MTPLDLAPDFFSPPRAGARSGEVAAFVQAIIAQAGDNLAQRLEMLWPVWSDVDQLVVARAAMTACCDDLSWTDEPESTSIAKRVSNTLLTFPELELDFNAAELAIRVLDYGRQSGHHAMLAYILDPTLLRALERLLLEAIQSGQVIAMTKIVSDYLVRFDNDVAITKILLEFDRARTHPPIAVLSALTDALKSKNNLAASVLCKSLRGALDKSESPIQGVDPIAMIARRAREVVGENHRTAPASRKPLLSDAENVRLGRVLRSLPCLTISASPPAQAQDHSASGEVALSDLMLELGGLTIGPTEFRTTYASTETDGSLCASAHKVPGPFQYGPYCELAEGEYSVSFLGEMLDGAEACFIVSSDYGGTVHISTSKKAAELSEDHSILATVRFSLSKSSVCEFSIEPEVELGVIRSRGVRLQLLRRSM